MNKLTKNKYQAFDEKSVYVFKKMQHKPVHFLYYKDMSKSMKIILRKCEKLTFC